MFQLLDIFDILFESTAVRYIIGGIIALIVIIICCAIHRKLMED